MGSKVRSRIPEPGYSILQQKHDFLCKELEARYLVDSLFSFLVFDDDDKDVIEKAESRSKRDGIRKLLDILRHSGPNAYEKFLEALYDKGFSHVAEELKATQVQKPEDPCAWIDDLSAEQKTLPLNEKHLSTLSGCFGSGWENVILNLGNTEAHIHHDKANNPFSRQMQIYSALNRWRQRLASDAILILLLTTMRNCTDTQIEWDLVKKKVAEI